MPVTPLLIIRIVLIAIVTCIVQIAAISQISILGVKPDLIPIVVGCVGLVAGSIAGAVMGFSIGLLLDLALLQTLGMSSLVYLIIGYMTGRMRELRDPRSPLATVFMGGFVAAVSIFCFAVIQFLFDVNVFTGVLLFGQVLPAVLLSALLALPIYLLVEKLLGGVVATTDRAAAGDVSTRSFGQ
jgi:rod shape-determining protein MreD